MRISDWSSDVCSSDLRGHRKGVGRRMTRLWAQDQDDAAVVSALMQDACVRPDEIAYDRAHRRFVILASRFCWEEKDAQRVRAALRIESVTGAQRRNWPEGSALPRSEESRVGKEWVS